MAERALSVAQSRLSSDPSDWRGWYLRFLADGFAPAAPDGWRELETLPAPVRGPLEALRQFLREAPGSRLELARSAVSRWPESDLARTILALALVEKRKYGEARKEAERVLRSDLSNFLAARALVRSVEGGADSGEEELFCSLLRVLACDSEIVAPALDRCPFEKKTPAERFALVQGVLAEHRGSGLARRALYKLGGPKGFHELPDPVWPTLLALLDPGDSSWISEAPRLAEAIYARPELSSLPGVSTFLGQLFEQKASVHPSDRARFFETIPLALSRALIRLEEPSKAVAVIEWVLPLVQPLRTVQLREELASALGALGRQKEAALARRQAFLLANPQAVSHGPPEDFEQLESLLHRLRGLSVRDRDGSPLFLPLTQRPQILFFWSATCWFSKKQARAVREAERVQPKGSLLDVVWINTDRDEFEAQREAFAAEIGISLRDPLYRVSREEQDLDDELDVYGTPWMVLVAPDGHVLLETRGDIGAGWLEQARAVANAHERARQRWAGSGGSIPASLGGRNGP
jgi:hypothetical protein